VEGELTWEWKFLQTGKIVVFANGAYQRVYKDGACAVTSETPGPCVEEAWGNGAGLRFELGPVHFGVAEHFGKGLGLNYALEGSYAALDAQSHLRYFDGHYEQLQVVLGRFDLFAGWGIARVYLTDLDKEDPRLSVIKWQFGINGGVVFNVRPNLHIDLEYFRAQADWWLGESQVLHCASTGMTFNW
jgi:hypothetical protein